MHVACEENLNLFGLKSKWSVEDQAARPFVSVNVSDLGIRATRGEIQCSASCLFEVFFSFLFADSRD